MVSVKYVMALLVFLCAGQLQADEKNTGNGAGASAIDEYYVQGRRAYNAGDYIGAVKYLFAYKTLKKESQNKDPNFEAVLESVLSQSEEQLRLAMRYREQMMRASAGSDLSQLAAFIERQKTAGVEVNFSKEGLEQLLLLEKQIELKRVELEMLEAKANLDKRDEGS
jgi:outer membrane protein assembly factor BamD (BamD/ComL family)